MGPRSSLRYRSPCFIPPLFFHLSASLLFLVFSLFRLFLPLSWLFNFVICGGGVGSLLWLLKHSSRWPSMSKPSPLIVCSPPSRLAWASLLNLFTSRLSLRLSGHVFLLPPSFRASRLLLLGAGWSSSPLPPAALEVFSGSRRGVRLICVNSLSFFCILMDSLRMSRKSS